MLFFGVGSFLQVGKVFEIVNFSREWVLDFWLLEGIVIAL